MRDRPSDVVTTPRPPLRQLAERYSTIVTLHRRLALILGCAIVVGGVVAAGLTAGCDRECSLARIVGVSLMSAGLAAGLAAELTNRGHRP